MAIYRLLKDHVFGPDEIKVLTTAYEEVLRALRLKDRADPATETIAKKIIELAQRGERDPVRLRERAIRCLSEWSAAFRWQSLPSCKLAPNCTPLGERAKMAPDDR